MQRWGDPRATQDVDLTLLTGFGREEDFISKLVAHFRPRRPDATQFALKSRVLLLFASNDVPIDIALGGLPFEERTIERSSLWQIRPGAKIVTCSAEDLVVQKAFAAAHSRHFVRQASAREPESRVVATSSGDGGQTE